MKTRTSFRRFMIRTCSLTLHRGLPCLISMQQLLLHFTRHLLTSTAEGGGAAQDSHSQAAHRRLWQHLQRAAIKLHFSLRHVYALRLLFLPTNLSGQAQSQTGKIWWSHRQQSRDRLPLWVWEAACSAFGGFQLLENFLSFSPNNKWIKKRLYRLFM